TEVAAMSPIHRPWVGGTVTIDVRLLEEIETATMIDEAPSPSVIAPLNARADELRDAYRSPEDDPELVEAAQKAMDWAFLNVWEAHAVQRLRGWHRTRYGRIQVSAGWLSAVRNLLDGLTLSLGDTCDEELTEISQEHDWDLFVTMAARI